MTYGIWIAVLLAGMACGAALVSLLVVRRPLEPFVLIGALALLGANSVVVIDAATYYGQAGVTAAIGVASLAAAAGGYGLASALLPLLFAPRQSHMPALAPPSEAGPAPGTIILLLACFESERYSPRRVAAELVALTEAGLPEQGIMLSPFLYAAHKARLRAMGGASPSASAARRLAVLLSESLGGEGTGPRTEVVDCSDPEALAREVADLATRGARDFIALGLSVGESYELDRAKSALDTLRPRDAGISITYTHPLWASEGLAGELARRILAAAEPDDVGVALVVHGQPDEHRRTHPLFDVQEDAFANRIRMLLSAEGIPDSSVRLCYHDWQTPDVSETVRHLAAVGCKHVVVAPVCFPLEGSQTILDIPISVNQARVDEHITTIVLSAWGESDTIVQILRDAVLDTAKESGRALETVSGEI